MGAHCGQQLGQCQLAVLPSAATESPHPCSRCSRPLRGVHLREVLVDGASLACIVASLFGVRGCRWRITMLAHATFPDTIWFVPHSTCESAAVRGELSPAKRGTLLRWRRSCS